MTNHPLHKIIGDIVQDNIFPNCKILKDRACGGKTQRIPLFRSNYKSLDTKYCYVDLLIIKDNKIRVIVEIEEANIKPTQICENILLLHYHPILFIKPFRTSLLIWMMQYVLFKY